MQVQTTLGLKGAPDLFPEAICIAAEPEAICVAGEPEARVAAEESARNQRQPEWATRGGLGRVLAEHPTLAPANEDKEDRELSQSQHRISEESGLR